MEFKYFLLVFGLICGTFINFIDGHNFLADPSSRGDQKNTQTGCRYGGEGNPTCAGPCDRTVSQMSIPAITVQRGQTLQIKWNRHTHPGGFVRFAWSPTSQSDAHSSFDSRVDRIVCKEIGGCGPSDPSQPTSTTNGINCGTTLTVPLYLTNGAWTLQWAYFGGWYNAGDYYACVDYVVSGGPTGSQQSPVYIGGDYTYPNQNKCLFHSTNALHVCTVEPCFNGTFPPGDQSGPALGFGGTVPFTTGIPTTGAKTSSPITSGRVQPQTTQVRTSGAVTTKAKTTSVITSARSSSSTSSSSSSSGRTSTSTTQPVTSHSLTSQALTTSVIASTTGASNTNTIPVGNCAGVSRLSISQAVLTYVDSWGSSSSGQYRGVIEIHVQEQILPYWYLMVTFPSTQYQPHLSSAVNGGSIQCQSNTDPYPHAIIKPNSWTTNVHSGTTITVEITGNNLAGLSADALIANTILQVYVS